MSKPKTLFIVDDDEDDKTMFTEVVSEIDPSIHCVKAANGYDALEMLKKDEVLPDYIFLDLNMPRMNGKHFLENLNKCGKLQGIPVIIYTTSNLPEDKENTKRLGAVHFITKPSSFGGLRAELEFVLSKKFLNVKLP